MAEEINASPTFASSKHTPIQLSNLGVQPLEENADPVQIFTILIMNEINIQF